MLRRWLAKEKSFRECRQACSYQQSCSEAHLCRRECVLLIGCIFTGRKFVAEDPK